VAKNTKRRLQLEIVIDDQGAVQSLKALNAGVTTLGTTSTTTGSSVKGMGDKVSGAGSQANAATQYFSNLAKTSAAVGSAAQSVGTALSLGVTAPLVGMGAASVKASIDFQTAFAGVKKTVTGTPEELARLNEQFRTMALTTPLTAVELANIGEQAGQLGVKKENITAFTKTIVDIASATHLTADEAGSSFARLANVMKMPQSEFGNLGSAVVALGNFGASTEQEMLSMGQRIAAAGATAHMTAPQVLGIANALSSVGIEAEAGGTAVSRVITQIGTDVMKGGGHLDLFAKTAGKSSTEFQRLWREDAGNAFSLFMGGLAKAGEKGGDHLLKLVEDLGFKEIRLRNAMLSAANAGDLMAESIALGTKAFKENTEIGRASGERYQTAANQFKLLGNNITDVGISIGDALVPKLLQLNDALKPVVQGARDLAKDFKEAPALVQNTVLAFAGFAALLGPLLFTLGGFALTFNQVALLFANVPALAGAATSAVGFFTTGLAGMVATTVGITGLIAAVGALGYAVGRLIDLASGGKISRWAEDFIAGGEKLKLVTQEAGAAQDTIQSAFEKTGVRAKSVAEAVALLTKWQQARLDAAFVGPRAQAEIDNTKAQGAAAQLTEEQLKKLAAIESKLTAGKRPLTAMQEEQRKTLTALGLSVDEVATKMGVHEIQIQKAAEAEKQRAKDLDDTIDRMDAFRESSVNAAQAIGIYTLPALRNLGVEMGSIQRAILEASRTDTAMLGLPRGNTAESAGHRFAQQFASPLMGGMKDLFSQQLPNVIQGALQGGGNVVASVGSAFGSKLGENISGKVGGFLTGSLGKTIGSALGSAIPVVGALVGPLVGKLFGKLFGGSEESQKVNNPRQQFIDAAGGLSALNDQVMRATGSIDLVKTLLNAKTEKDYKVAVDAITQAVNGFNQKMQATQQLLGTVSQKLQQQTALTPELEAALQLAYDAKTPDEYAAAIANVNSLMDAQSATANELKSTMEKYGITWDQAGQKAKEAHMNELAVSLTKDFNILRDSGMDINVQMAKMSPNLKQFITDAQKAGVEIPNSMKPVLQAAIDAGQLFDKDGKQVKSLTDLGLTFGDTMQESMGKVKDSIERLADVLEKMLPAGLRASDKAAKDLTGTLNNIPRDIDVDVNINRTGDEVPGVATGGFVAGKHISYYAGGGVVLPFHPRGTDTVPAMLTPGEGIVNRRGMANLGRQGLADLNRGGTVGGGGLVIQIGDVHVQSGLDNEDDLGRAISDAVTHKMRMRGVRFSRTRRKVA
jgi:TP901 family phage tail tape measure protein